MKKFLSRIIALIKRLTGRDIQEKQLDELDRTRKLLIALIDHSTRSSKKTITLDHSISIFQKDFSRYFQSHEKILEIVRSEPFTALNRWISQTEERERAANERDRASQSTHNELIRRWKFQVDSLESTIASLHQQSKQNDLRWQKYVDGMQALVNDLQKQLQQKDVDIQYLCKLKNTMPYASAIESGVTDSSSETDAPAISKAKSTRKRRAKS